MAHVHGDASRRRASSLPDPPAFHHRRHADRADAIEPMVVKLMVESLKGESMMGRCAFAKPQAELKNRNLTEADCAGGDGGDEFQSAARTVVMKQNQVGA